MTSEVRRPATYREVFGVTEYRAIFSAHTLSLIGDMFAKVAVSILVFDQTKSPLLSAAAFALSYLPWIVGGPFLAALADRFPWRRTLVAADLIRVALVTLLAIPGMPLPLLLVLLFASSLLAPPFEAARSALLPAVLTGDRYVIGLALNNMAAQLSQVIGFAFGGAAVALLTARGALLVNAVTFLVSAILLRVWVLRRPAPAQPHRSTLRKDTMDGLRLVFSSRVLRTFTIMVWLSAAFVYAPEGLATPLADEIGGGAGVVGLILAANPVGTMIGGVVIGRFLPPQRRIRVLRPLALLASAALIPLAVPLPLWAVLALFVLSGFGMSFLLPLNAMFVHVVPASYRGRAFGVVQSGLQVGQGLAILGAGWLANSISTRHVIGITGAVGLVVVAVIALSWPPREELDKPVPEPQ